MYIPDKYRLQDKDKILQFIKENPFGILITSDKTGTKASHIPFMLEANKDGDYYLEGHLARANQQSKELLNGMEGLVVFNGPHAYISSSWYKKEEVPTWNYIAVHARGPIELMDNNALHTSLDKLVRCHESATGYDTQITDYSERTMRQIKAILGFTLHIQTLDAAFKLSQGREEDHPAIIHNLDKGGPMSRAIAKKIKDFNSKG